MKERELGSPRNSFQEKLPGFAPQTILRFMRDATLDGAHRRVPQSIKRARWAKNLTVVKSRLYTEASLETIGGRYNCTRQNVHSTVRRTIRQLWENSSESTKQKYPLDELLTRKPVSKGEIERWKGVSFKVARALREGQTIEKIREELGLSLWQIAGARRVLGRWGIAVPFGQRYSLMQARVAENRRLAEELQKPYSDREIQKLLSKVTRAFIERDQKQEQRSLVSVIRLALDAGFHFWGGDAHKFVESLEKKKLPVGKPPRIVKSAPRKDRPLFVIVAQHKDRATRVLLSDPNLQRFRRTP